MKNQAIQYLAFDVHQATTVATVRDEHGAIRLRATVPTEASAIVGLAQLISTYLSTEPFELWPIQDLTESEKPWGTIDFNRSAFVPQTFFFNERFLYRVAASNNSR